MIRKIALCLVGILAISLPMSRRDARLASASSEEEPKSGYEFTVTTSIVNVAFTVVDQEGRPVADLTRDDFIVLEDGRRQQIKHFSRELEQPLRIVLVFDKSKSVLKRFPFMQRATVDFLRSLLRPSEDWAALISFDEKPELRQGFTCDIARLEAAIEGLEAIGGTSLFDAVAKASEQLLGEGVAGRRVMVLVTDGEDTASDLSLEEAVKSALAADAVVYAIGVKSERSLNDRDRQGRPTLKKLAGETGGRAFFPDEGEEELAELFRQLERELRNQYVIAYISTNRGREAGEFRKIEILTANKDYKVRARKGYYVASRAEEKAQR